MAGTKLTIRTIDSSVAQVDPLYNGEIVWDTDKNRVGIYYSTALYWLSTLDLATGELLLEMGIDYTGKTSYGDINDMRVNFSTADAVEINHGGGILASFSSLSTDLVMGSFAPQNRGASTNVHPVLSPYYSDDSDRTILDNTSTTYSEPWDAFVQVPHSNMVLWAKQAPMITLVNVYMTNPGEVTAAFDSHRGNINSNSLDQSALSSPSIAITAPSHPAQLQNIGLRSWIFDTSLLSHPLTFVFTVNAERNAVSPLLDSFLFRCGPEGEYRMRRFVCEWENNVFAYEYNPDHFSDEAKSQPFAIDWVTNYLLVRSAPSLATPTLLSNFAILKGHWRYNEGDYDYQYGFSEDYALTGVENSSVMAHQLNFLVQPNRNSNLVGSDLQKVNFDFPLATIDYDIEELHSDYPATITDKTMYGFSIKADTAPANTMWRYNYNVYCRGTTSDIRTV